jgi:hypothetical protein
LLREGLGGGNGFFGKYKGEKSVVEYESVPGRLFWGGAPGGAAPFFTGDGMRTIISAMVVACLAGAASAQVISGGGSSDIYSVIPNDCAVLVVTNEYGAALAALDGLLKASIPESVNVSGPAADAIFPLVRALPALRKDVGALAAAQAGGVKADRPAAAALIVWAPNKAAGILIRQVDEAAWLKAHPARAKESLSGVVTVGGERPFAYVIERGFVVAAADAATLEAYNKMKTRPLTSQRTSPLQLALTSKTFAANVSMPTLRSVYGAPAFAGEAMARAVDAWRQAASIGIDTTPLPRTVIVQALSDLVAQTDEMFFSADVSTEGVTLSGNLSLQAAGLYRLMLAEQEGGAADAAALMSPRPAAVASLSLQGPLFWEYAKGYPPRFVAGFPAGGGTTSLSAWTAAADTLREKVGLSNAAVVWSSTADGRRPSPIFVAEAADGKAAMDAMAQIIKALYGDEALKAYCGTLGLILQPPAVETAAVQGRPVTTVKIPFTMSAAEPVKVAKVRQLLGTELVWRATAASFGPRQVVVAGDFPTVDSLMAFVNALQPRALDGRAAKSHVMLAVDLPRAAAARLNASLKQSGKKPLPLTVPVTARPITLAIGPGADGASIEAELPADQVRCSYATINSYVSAMSAAVVNAAAEKRGQKPGKRSGESAGEETPCPEDESAPRSPWGRR